MLTVERNVVVVCSKMHNVHRSAWNENEDPTRPKRVKGSVYYMDYPSRKGRVFSCIWPWQIVKRGLLTSKFSLLAAYTRLTLFANALSITVHMVRMQVLRGRREIAFGQIIASSCVANLSLSCTKTTGLFILFQELLNQLKTPLFLMTFYLSQI